MRIRHLLAALALSVAGVGIANVAEGRHPRSRQG